MENNSNSHLIPLKQGMAVKKFFKLFFIIVFMILLIVIYVVACTGDVIFEVAKGVKNLANSAMDAGPQTEILTADGVRITKPLRVEHTIVLNGVQLCKKESQSMLNYGYSSFCNQDICTTTISYGENPIPEIMTIYQTMNGNCVEQTLYNVKDYIVPDYKGKIKISLELAEQLHIHNFNKTDLQKTANSKFHDYFEFGINGDDVITLDYGQIAPTDDEFLFNSKLINVHYENIPSKP